MVTQETLNEQSENTPLKPPFGNVDGQLVALHYAAIEHHLAALKQLGEGVNVGATNLKGNDVIGILVSSKLGRLGLDAGAWTLNGDYLTELAFASKGKL